MKCLLQYSVYRSRDRIAVYHSGDGHGEGCVPTRSHLPIGMLIQAQLANGKSPGLSIYNKLKKDSLQKILKYNVKEKTGRDKIVRGLNRHVLSCREQLQKTTKKIK